MTRAAFEAALDSGLLQTRIRGQSNGVFIDSWYTCRRNGRTQIWKRDTSRFIVPVKFRLKDCMRVEDKHFYNGTVDQWFRIVEPTE